MEAAERFSWKPQPPAVDIGVSLPASDLGVGWTTIAIRLSAQGRTFIAQPLDESGQEEGPQGYGVTPEAAIRSMTKGLSQRLCGTLTDRLRSQATVFLRRRIWSVEVILRNEHCTWSAKFVGGRFNPFPPASVGKGSTPERALEDLLKELEEEDDGRRIIKEAMAAVRQHRHCL